MWLSRECLLYNIQYFKTETHTSILDAVYSILYCTSAVKKKGLENVYYPTFSTLKRKLTLVLEMPFTVDYTVPVL